MRKSVAVNYARALVDVAVERDEIERVAQDLEGFLRMWHESGDLEEALVSPAIPFSAKRGVVEAIADRAGYSKALVNFFLTLLQRARMQSLPRIVEAFRQENDRRRGIERAEVFSSKKLGEENRARLQRELSRKVGKQLRFDYSLDPSLIGGLKVQVGSTVYDGSIRTQLDEIQRRLSGR